jgi:putative transposase
MGVVDSPAEVVQPSQADVPVVQGSAAVFIDAIYVKLRDGQVGNRPFYAAIGVDLAGRRDVLGLWAGTGGGESAKFWLAVLTELKNRGMADAFFIVCDGLKGLPDSANTAFPLATVQTCVIHLIRGSFRYASKRYWEALAKDLRPIYTAVDAKEAWAAFETLEEKWGKPYPAIPKLWRAAWEQFIPFLAYDIEIRRVLCSTNAIESLNALYRRAVTAKGHSPPSRPRSRPSPWSPDPSTPKGTGQARWVTSWKPALNAFAITYADRMPAAENL